VPFSLRVPASDPTRQRRRPNAKYVIGPIGWTTEDPALARCASHPTADLAL
jgi:hypothetical protein